MTPFIPKAHPDLPDNYGVTIFFMSGKEKQLEVASHKVVNTVVIYDAGGSLKDQDGKAFRFEPAPIPLFECWTKDDLLFSAPLSSISHMEFDKRFSAMKAIQAKMAKENAGKMN